MPTKIEKDEITGTDTTGHEWDGIKELNTPLPKWWVYVFYATIAWSLVWYVLYPAWPSFSSHTPGVLGYTSRGALRERMAEVTAERAPILSRIREASLEQIRQNPELLAFATVGGRTMFAENCAPCHGPGGAGRRGYPNLADDVWLWGGRLADIHQTIRHGIRTGSDQARASQMPRFGADGILTSAQILDVTEFVLSLTNRATDQERAGRGARVYADSCASCHGDRGEGKLEFGAPRLNSAVWLYGGDRATIIESIAQSRGGVMPAWVDRLDEATVKMLTIYVHALGGGQ